MRGVRPGGSGRAAPPPRDALPVCCWRKEKGKREELPPPSPAPPRRSRGDRATAPPRLPVAGPASSVSVAPAAACGDRVGGRARRLARAGCGAGAGGRGPSPGRPLPSGPRQAVGVRPVPGRGAVRPPGSCPCPCPGGAGRGAPRPPLPAAGALRPAGPACLPPRPRRPPDTGARWVCVAAPPPADPGRRARGRFQKSPPPF